ncbi:MAG: hypothetical protein AAFO79_05400, partial [Pseudomonadota bacterium]
MAMTYGSYLVILILVATLSAVAIAILTGRLDGRSDTPNVNTDKSQSGGSQLLASLFGGHLFAWLGRVLRRMASLEAFANWRLVLLGITGVVLSVSSGWTTWDGMTNFTQSPVLSLLITFGIQGIMLIAAWLIGETFAQSFTGKGGGTVSGFAIGLIIVAGLMTIARFAATFVFSNTPETLDNFVAESQRFAFTNSETILTAAAIMLLIIVVVTTLGSKEVLAPYLRGVKTILAKNMNQSGRLA